MVKTRILTAKILVSVAVLLLSGVAPFTLLSMPVYSQPSNLPNRGLIISSAFPSDTNVIYDFSFDLTTAGNLGSIQLQFCANDPLIGQPCTVPSGFDISGATVNSQSGETGFSIHASSTANNMILTRAPAPLTPQTNNYQFTGVTNADSAGSQYVRVVTFATQDATGPHGDEGGIAFSLSDGLSLSTTVPPFLLFCAGVTIAGNDCLNVTGSGIDVGVLRPTSTASGTSQLLIATNADFGYTITTIGTTLTSGNFAIDGMSNRAASSPGTNQFGMNLRDNSSPNTGINPTGPGLGIPAPDYNVTNQYKFLNGDVIAFNNDESNINKYTASYIINVAQDKEPGVYSTTLTFLALASF